MVRGGSSWYEQAQHAGTARLLATPKLVEGARSILCALLGLCRAGSPPNDISCGPAWQWRQGPRGQPVVSLSLRKL